jgi:uncharacterized damage-inducible protein DinB
VAIKDALLPEFDHETGTTRRLLERVPEDRLAWKPHQKSMTMGRLAMHLAEVPGYGHRVVSLPELDFDTSNYKPREATSRGELLSVFDESVAATRKALDGASDGELMAVWTMKADGKPLFSLPRIAALRTLMMNHMIHHRGQLSVYLRENDVPLPSIYGPTADEK